MYRVVMTAGALAALLGVAACGSSGTAAGSSPSPSASNGQRGAGRNGAAGELVQINGMRLILNSQNGDITVVYTTSTQMTRTSTGTVSDIVAGTCIVATGQKDAGGQLNASTVRLSDKVNGACDFGRPGGPGGPDGSPRPAPSGTPRPFDSNFAFAGGEVTAVSGTSVFIKGQNGTTQTVTVPTTVRVAKSSPTTPSDLSVGECIVAAGTRDSSGTVTARTLSIVPAGPNGCTAGGGFGGFGFGRGRGGFGGGNGGQPTAPPSV